MGSASPFSNGLNAVITRPYATLVRSLTLRGEWRELELEEHARVGRVPDSSMMLNIAVRAAIDRMTELESFSWELNTKMLETVYLGLSQLSRLTDLTIRFPSSRHPRPTIVIPPMPHLRRLKLTDIDPLCYPDDISTLLWKCKKLRDLYMHWSPRMRNAQEPSVMLHDYFRKCNAAREPLGIKKLALQNLYAFHTEEFNHAFDPKTVEEITLLNNSGSDEPSFMNTFVDRSWPAAPPHERLRIKCIRQDTLSKRNAEFLANFTGLEKFYYVNGTRDANDILNFPNPSHGNNIQPTSHSRSHSTTSVSSPVSKSPSSNNALTLNLQESHLNALITNHSATLRHLLLPSRWALSANTIYRLVHACPQLEQLAFAADVNSLDVLGILLPFLRKLAALRILIPTGNGASSLPRSEQSSHTTNGDTATTPRNLTELVEQDDEFQRNKMSRTLSDKAVHNNLRVIGVGRKAWELLDFYPASPEEQPRAISDKTNGIRPPFSGNDNNNSSSSNSNSNNKISTHTNQRLGPSPLQSPLKPRPQTNPFSILGKRARDEINNLTPPPSTNDARHPHPAPPVDNVESPQPLDPECGPWHMSPDAHLWRRRVRSVGWEVLRHWEIWELDKQEL